MAIFVDDLYDNIGAHIDGMGVAQNARHWSRVTTQGGCCDRASGIGILPKVSHLRTRRSRVDALVPLATKPFRKSDIETPYVGWRTSVRSRYGRSRRTQR